jgi:hypothetical protein
MKLEFPTDQTTISNLIHQIRALPGDEATGVIKALRAQLITDFFFMPATYGGIFILCMAAACRQTHSIGLHHLLLILAWGQSIALMCDIIENIYLLKQSRQPSAFTKILFSGYKIMETLKWGTSVSGLLLASFELTLGLLFQWL